MHQKWSQMMSFQFMIRNMPKTHKFLQSRVATYVRICFLQISRKVKVLELRVVLSAYINSCIAVILSPNLTLYDLQKLRYGIRVLASTLATSAAIFELFATTWDFATKKFVFSRVELGKINWETESTLLCIHNHLSPRSISQYIVVSPDHASLALPAAMKNC